jgi:LPXTG-site transpeptidase (sortase) family protein
VGALPPPFLHITIMNRYLATILVTIGLLAAACSSAVGSTTDDQASAPPAPVATTTTTTAVPPSTSAAPESTMSAPTSLSPLADRVTELGSARYDPAEHTDDEPVPTSISIGSIGVAGAPVVDVGVEADGDMEIPGAEAVGWYRFNPTPGEQGSAVLSAHIAYNGRNGVFRYLSDVAAGDRVTIGYDDGSEATFEVVEVAQYDKQALPLDRIFAKDGDPVLTLITCGGEFNPSLRSYEDNFVAYAVPVTS